MSFCEFNMYNYALGCRRFAADRGFLILRRFKMKKKFISLLTALSMTLMLFGMPNIAAFNDGHTHKACGGLAHENCDHEDIVFEELPIERYLSILRTKTIT